MSFYVYVAQDGQQTYPLTLTDLRFMRRDVSFPAQISDADAALFGFYPVRETAQPEGRFQTATRSAAQIKGEWVEQWTVTPWTQDQIDAATEQQWTEVRAERNRRLLDCDWTQLPDAPLSDTDKQAWADYRQELRDITTQTDPFGIVWPNTVG